jgi:hypothetical protein
MKRSVPLRSDASSESDQESSRPHAAHPLQRQVDTSPRQLAQRAKLAQMQTAQPPDRQGGLPPQLRAGIESLSGMDMGDVAVHRNSAKPAQLNAHAYAQGNDIHLGPGQDKHLPHEAWHVVQQRQGRVRATTQMVGMGINDDQSLEREADVKGAQAAMGVQASRAPTPQTSAGSVSTSVQRRVALDDASDIKSWDSDELDSGSEELEDVTEELADDFDWNPHSITEFEKLVAAPALYRFRDYDHLGDFMAGNFNDPPTLEDDSGMDESVDGIAKDFGSAFKGPKIPFSGSRVYAVGKPGTVGEDLWATQNSATGHITSKQQSVVRAWTAETPAKLLLDKLSFPSNTKRDLEKVKLGRPTVMASNAHAEVNQYVQLALLSAAHGLNPSDVGLSIGSDIAHCAECFWALHAMQAKGTGRFGSFTGCENKLFARWREPWSGFYATYGPNPFRDGNGKFKQNPLTKKDFAAGSYTPQELNAASAFKIYS